MRGVWQRATLFGLYFGLSLESDRTEVTFGLSAVLSDAQPRGALRSQGEEQRDGVSQVSLGQSPFTRACPLLSESHWMLCVSVILLLKTEIKHCLGCFS